MQSIPNRPGLDLRSTFQAAFSKYRDTTAIRTPSETLSYADLDRRSNAIASALVADGVEREGRVGILMENRPAYAAVYLGIVKAGATEVPLNEMLTPSELEYRLSDADVSHLVVGPSFLEDAADFKSEIDTLDTCIGITDGESLPDRLVAYEAFVGDHDVESPPEVTIEPHHEVRHSYTGGTTGPPKGVVHTHLSRTINLYSHVIELEFSASDTLWLSTPLPHSAGTFMTASWLAGSTAELRAGFDPEETLRAIEDKGVTWTFLVPTMIYKLLDRDDVDTYDTGTLETVVYGAAPMTPNRLREAIDIFDSIFIQFYGQTGVPNLITTLTKVDHTKALESGPEELLSSAGRPCVMTEVRIVDPETGDPLPPREIGEITATAPYVFEEYYGRPVETEDTLQDGWVHTGDVGRMDEDGYVYLLDRINDVIISGGMNVYSIEVEEVIDDHSDVNEVAVIGVPHDTWGEAVKAVIVPEPGAEVDETDVIEFCEGRLADFKNPKSVDVVESIPKTPYGKIDKKELREDYWDGDRDIA